MLDLRTSLLLGMIFPALACGSEASSPVTGAGGSNVGTSGSGGAGAAGRAAGGAGGAMTGNAGSTGGGAAGSTSGGAPNGGSAGSGGAAPVTGCTPPDDVFSPIEKLTATGCVDLADPRKPVARAIPYEVNSPLWSDASDKTRAFVLPPGTKIKVLDCKANPADCPMGTADDGRWVFPVGAVMIKTFAFDGKLVETRLFMHLNADNWYGYGYAWNEAQTEATVVSSSGEMVTFNTGTRSVSWQYPSQKDCTNCHNQATGSTIGPETAQMNRVVGGMNQIDKFAALGLFANLPPQPYKAALVAPYPSQAGSPPTGATIETKARSYLHANCAFCHRPGGNFPNFDLRNDTLPKDWGVCNVEVLKGAIKSAPTKTKILVPGSDADSVLWLRMSVATPEEGRMPQIASFAVDNDALGLVGTWIKSLTACPQ